MFFSTSEFRQYLEDCLMQSRHEVVIFSAYAKIDALNWILAKLTHRNVRFVTSFQPRDLVNGASDIGCFHVCNDLAIPFGILPKLHSKVYVVDDRVFTGSWNMTASGLALRSDHNIEAGAEFAHDNSSRSQIERLLSKVQWLTSELVDDMDAFLSDQIEVNSAKNIEWPLEIQQRLLPPNKPLWFHDLPQCSPELIWHDENSPVSVRTISALSLRPPYVRETISDQFMGSAIYQWLRAKILEKGTLSFGGLTNHFHSDINDDPTPYRKEIKEGIGHLFRWVEDTDTELEIFRPNHSQVIRMRSNSQSTL